VEAVVHGKRFLHVVMKRHALLIGKVRDRNLAAFLVQDAKRGVCSISAEVVDSPKEITSLSEDREGVDRVSGRTAPRRTRPASVRAPMWLGVVRMSKGAPPQKSKLNRGSNRVPFSPKV